MRDTAVADRIVYRWGPGSRRVPRRLRRAATPQAKIPGLPGARSWSFGPPEFVTPVSPRTLGGELTLSRQALRSSRLPTPFVAELADVWLVGRHAVPFTAGRNMLLTGLRDSVGTLSAEPNPDLETWITSGEEAASMATELMSAIGSRPVCSLVGRFDSNYFHWLTDACGQMEGIAEYDRRTGIRPLILVRAGAPAFVRDSLAILGVEPETVVEWPASWSAEDPARDIDLVALRVRTLVVSAWRNYRYGCSPRSLAWLRAAFLGTPNGTSAVASEKVYIQRPQSGWRHILNEDDVHQNLVARGFLVVRPAERPFTEQIDVFRRASLIVGQHGAGLANLLFAPRASVVELVGDYGGPEYASMCSALGNAYTRVQCEDRSGNIIVDLDVLAAALDPPGQR